MVDIFSYNSLSLSQFVLYLIPQVLYHAEGFLEKNRDKLDSNLKKAMINSVNPFISDLFQAEETDTGGISRQVPIKI